MNYFLFFSFGRHSYKQEALYAIESLRRTIKAEDKVKIVLYTDNPEFFYPYYQNYSRLILEPIDEETMDEWKRELDYPPFAKFKVLEQFSKKYKGKVIYTDSDILFIKSIMHMFHKINDHSFFMYQLLSPIQNIASVMKKTTDGEEFATACNHIVEGFTANGKAYRPPRELPVYDSGFIGLDTDNIHLIHEAMQILLDLYPKIELPYLDKIALSLVLQDNGRNIVDIFDQHITYHYSSYRHTRLVLGYLMDLLTPYDWDLLEEMKRTYKLGPLTTYGICTENLQAFITFLETVKHPDTNRKSLLVGNARAQNQEQIYFQLMFKKFYKAYYSNQRFIK